MLIVSDLGTEVVNTDQAFSFSIGQTPDGAYVLVAFGGGSWQTPIVVGSKERCERALGLITQGVKQRQHIVDLLGVLGQRPDIAVPQPKIVLPGNGEGRP
jgi:hypothetical protein